MHDSLDIVMNDLKGSSGLMVHHVLVRISYHSSYSVLRGGGGGGGGSGVFRFNWSQANCYVSVVLD